MAVNVLDRIEQLFNEAAIKSTAEAIGASREAVSAAIRPSLATVIKSVVSRSETADGAEYLLRIVSEFEGAVLGNFSQLIGSGSYGDVSAVGKRVANSLFGEDESDCVDQVAGLAGLNHEQAASVLHSVTGLVFDLAGEERSKNSQNRLGVTKFFEAQRTLLRAEIATHILESVGLIEANFDTRSCDLDKFAPSEDESFVPPVQMPDSLEINPGDTDPSIQISGRNRQETAESLGLSGVTLQEDEPDRLGDEVASALSDSKPRTASIIDPEELAALGQQEKAGQEFVDEAEVVLSDGETRAFHIKAILALATLATLWFTLLNLRPSREPSEQVTPTAQMSASKLQLASQTSPEEGSSAQEPITEVRHSIANTLTSTATFAGKEEPADLFAIDATPAKTATAMGITPGTAVAKLFHAEFGGDSQEYSATTDLSSQSIHASNINSQSQLFGNQPTGALLGQDSPHVDLQSYGARPAVVRMEPVSASEQTPGLIGFKVVDSFRIPVFLQARETGKSYYSP